MTWAHSKEIAETIESILKSIAVVAAGCWAYWKLFLHAEHETSISPGLDVAVLDCGVTNRRVLEIRSTLENRGTVPCQLDLQRSTVTVRILNLPVDSQAIDVRTCQCLYEGFVSEEDILNIPVGASKDEVVSVPVPHPGTYHVNVFFAQTERDARKFYRRVRMKIPGDSHENWPGWANEKIVSTYASDSPARWPGGVAHGV